MYLYLIIISSVFFNDWNFLLTSIQEAMGASKLRPRKNSQTGAIPLLPVWLVQAESVTKTHHTFWSQSEVPE